MTQVIWEVCLYIKTIIQRDMEHEMPVIEKEPQNLILP
jgi:hypothetical protein